jgi:hypothetical protein
MQSVDVVLEETDEILMCSAKYVNGKVFEIQSLSKRSELTDHPAFWIALANKPSAFSAAPFEWNLGKSKIKSQRMRVALAREFLNIRAANLWSEMC